MQQFLFSSLERHTPIAAALDGTIAFPSKQKAQTVFDF